VKQVIASYRVLTMLKADRDRLDPTDERTAVLTRQFGSVRSVYNWALALATTTDQTQGQGITRCQFDKRLTALKQEWPWLGEVASQPWQQARRHLDTAFTRFFARRQAIHVFTPSGANSGPRGPKALRFIGRTAFSTFLKPDGLKRC
jgi:putative transposase